MLTVRQILEAKGTNFWAVPPSATVYEALQLMADKDIGALLVLDHERVAGIFSERDYARKVILKGRSSKETTVSELMSTPVSTVRSDQTIEDCMKLMTSRKYRHLPVVDGNTLMGVISIGDVVNALISSQKTTIRDLETFICGADYPQVEQIAAAG